MNISRQPEHSFSTSQTDREFDAARASAALVDRSGFGRIEVTGKDRLDLLHRLSTNDLLAAKPGQAVSTVFTTDKGRIVDYVRVLLRDSSLLLITSPGNQQRFTSWVDKYCIMEDIRFNDVTSDTRMCSLIGPQSYSIISALFGVNVSSTEFIELTGQFGNLIVCSRHEFETSAVDIVVPQEHIGALMQHVLAKTEREGVRAMHEETYEAFRISRGIPKIGSELSEAFNPYEAGLRHAISFTKGCYIGQEVIARLDTYQKIQRSMIGLFLASAPHSGAHLSIRYKNADIGVLTSVSTLPVHGKILGLGIVKKDHAFDGAQITIDDAGSTVSGVLSRLPIRLDPHY